MMSLYRQVLARRRDLDPAAALQWSVDDEHLLAFRRGEVAIVLNPTPVARPVPSSVVGDRHVVLSSVHGHADPHNIPADSCLWLSGSA
jgi:hypothetical protein